MVFKKVSWPWHIVFNLQPLLHPLLYMGAWLWNPRLGRQSDSRSQLVVNQVWDDCRIWHWKLLMLLHCESQMIIECFLHQLFLNILTFKFGLCFFCLFVFSVNGANFELDQTLSKPISLCLIWYCYLVSHKTLLMWPSYLKDWHARLHSVLYH